MKLPIISNLFKKKHTNYLYDNSYSEAKTRKEEVTWYRFIVSLGLTLLLLILSNYKIAITSFISPLSQNISLLHSLQQGKSGHEVFGFGTYWTLDKLQNVDFNVLTTFAYFGIPVNSDGTLDTTDPGYQGFYSQTATNLFKKAHAHSTRVVLTLTQMDDDTINAFLSSPQAQQTTIKQAVKTVTDRGIDGINVDFEYSGNDTEYQQNFSSFIKNLTTAMHKAVPSARVTTSIYASAGIQPRIYNLASIAQNSDGIFMMAYDFATSNSDITMPTAPLYGHSQGFYWYDVSTAVSDFLTEMPADKLILGVPWYGYNYPVYQPGIKSTVMASWVGGDSYAQTYDKANASIVTADATQTKEGWDGLGQVPWKAYLDPQTGVWHEVFMENTKSLGMKYDFAIKKNLLGVGIWAMGFDNGHTELWNELETKFGTKYADASIIGRDISGTN